MICIEDISHLEWLINRIINKFGDRDSDDHIVYAKDIIQRLYSSQININDHDLDQIITKYYADFFMDKCELWGFTQEERQNLRTQIRDICQDIINFQIRTKE